MRFKIVIISTNRGEAEDTARCFYAYGCDIAAIGTTGRDALALVREHRPDVLITDPFLPFYNCDELASFLEQETPQMVKIALSSERNDRIAEQFLECGGDFFLVQPLDYSYCLKRIEKYHLLRTKQSTHPAEETPELRITRRLQMEMKMPITVNGFLYLQEAIALAAKDHTLTKKMISRLYPTVGVRFKVKPECVERCIRTAIANTFESGDLDFLQQYFADAFQNKNGRPSNKEFIGRMAELVRSAAMEK